MRCPVRFLLGGGGGGECGGVEGREGEEGSFGVFGFGLDGFGSVWWDCCLRAWCRGCVAPEGFGDCALIGFERCILSWVMAFLDWED